MKTIGLGSTVRSGLMVLAASAALAGCASGGRGNDATVRLSDRPECHTSQAVDDARTGVRDLVDPRCRPEEATIWSSRDDGAADEIDFRRRTGDD
ncbi:hypothetical protein QFW77_14495 [Luteimonas sp. RD2P54]|uniref:Entry exclusion lipoprotein TrbK n=1 Tax=Luteimonas endophytica TaxID=3042023 RepID=A0ABT6JBI6_9GAMM|nr:hypothetical protein [Luteimonas endophytica]MDH5824187.1 hypothetical protein [Luteimonas endophytica]